RLVRAALLAQFQDAFGDALEFSSPAARRRFFLGVRHGNYLAKATPTLTLRKRAGEAPCPVPMVCMGCPLPQLGVPHSVQCSREQMASQLFQNSVVMPL